MFNNSSSKPSPYILDTRNYQQDSNPYQNTMRSPYGYSNPFPDTMHSLYGNSNPYQNTMHPSNVQPNVVYVLCSIMGHGGLHEVPIILPNGFYEESIAYKKIPSVTLNTIGFNVPGECNLVNQDYENKIYNDLNQNKMNPLYFQECKNDILNRYSNIFKGYVQKYNDSMQMPMDYGQLTFSYTPDYNRMANKVYAGKHSGESRFEKLTTQGPLLTIYSIFVNDINYVEKPLFLTLNNNITLQKIVEYIKNEMNTYLNSQGMNSQGMNLVINMFDDTCNYSNIQPDIGVRRNRGGKKGKKSRKGKKGRKNKKTRKSRK